MDFMFGRQKHSDQRSSHPRPGPSEDGPVTRVSIGLWVLLELSVRW